MRWLNAAASLCVIGAAVAALALLIFGCVLWAAACGLVLSAAHALRKPFSMSIKIDKEPAR